MLNNDTLPRDTSSQMNFWAAHGIDPTHIYEDITAPDKDMEAILKELCASVDKIETNAGEAFTQLIGDSLPQVKELGELLNIAAKYFSAEKTPLVNPKQPYTAIFCADHGVAAESVSAYPPETTLHMAANYVISRGAAANALANFVHADLDVFDVGIKADTSKLPIDSTMKIAEGTNNSAQGPAMTRSDALKALWAGISVAVKAANAGYSVLLAGEMGISNTTASAAITAAICQLAPEITTGRGTNISTERLKRKIATVEKILAVNKPNHMDGIDVLAKVGGFELGAIAGYILGAAFCRTVVVLDGFNTSAAALIAATICPQSRGYLLASHLAGEQGHRHALDELGLQPVMQLDLKLGEAIGSSLLADLLLKLINTSQDLIQALFKPYEPKDIEFSHILHTELTLTDKTFDFYTKTMPELNQEAMEKCQERLDNLAKPIYSLGVLESIALQLSGLTSKPRPMEYSPSLHLFEIVNDVEDYDTIPAKYGALLERFAKDSGTQLTVAQLISTTTQMAGFEFGRREAEYDSLSNDVVGIGILADAQFKSDLATALVNEDGSLRYNATDFLAHLEPQQQLIASTILGGLVSAAHNSSMLILDDVATTAISRYAIQLLPALESFILPLEPKLYQFNMTLPGFTALAGINLVRASLHMLNDMRTFAEAQVAVANDGPGKGRQVN